LELRVDLAKHIRWPDGGGFQPIEMLINGINFIDIIRAVELPFAEREYDERRLAGESAEQLGLRGAWAGNYLFLPASWLIKLRNCRNWILHRRKS
jgi:hypothetical protein